MVRRSRLGNASRDVDRDHGVESGEQAAPGVRREVPAVAGGRRARRTVVTVRPSGEV